MVGCQKIMFNDAMKAQTEEVTIHICSFYDHLTLGMGELVQPCFFIAGTTLK